MPIAIGEVARHQAYRAHSYPRHPGSHEMRSALPAMTVILRSTARTARMKVMRWSSTGSQSGRVIPRQSCPQTPSRIIILTNIIERLRNEFFHTDSYRLKHPHASN